MLYGETEIKETVDALKDKESQAVSVSIDQLKNIELNDPQTVKRFSGIYYPDENSKKTEIKLTPRYTPYSPYSDWKIIVKNVGVAGSWRDLYEQCSHAKTVSWLPYITTAFLQWEPGTFLEYLRLIQSTHGNPWVDPVFYGERQAGKRFYWADNVSGGEVSAATGYPPRAMYPHTRTDDGTLNMAITVDRFIETLIYDALGEAFTILDISRTTDPDFLDMAYSKVLNRSQYIKAQISETSTVRVLQSGKIVASYSVSLNPELQTLFKTAADDALVLIRQNRDKLAARAIEVRDLLSKNVAVSFVGPKWLDPLTPAATNLSLSELEQQMSVRKIAVRTSTSAPVAPVAPAVAAKKKNYLLPVAGVAAAALGIYAATR